ncbi:hypothetical protein [Prosthecochloris vibrioformis]|uniref:hypothetical protein n=1 Tax=Prosthecochloris vibrioformis TaxID=1098 RepID=UPI0011181ACB|nr:hypothetical protein [Prosthecochloris vibrioformis]
MKSVYRIFMTLVIASCCFGCAGDSYSKREKAEIDAMLDGYGEVDVEAKPIYKTMPSIKK